MAPKKIKVKPGKTQSKIGFIVGILFVILGVFVVIPTFGLFGLIWTGVAAMIAFTHYKNGFSDEGVATHEIIIEDALEVCEDERLKHAISLAFSCSLRLGELLGLTWDCIDISDEAIAANKAFVFINKEAQRVDKKALVELDRKDVMTVFPERSKTNKTVLVLKTPKTESSVRKVFLPRTVAYQLIAWRKEQEKLKDVLGSEYTDYNLVMATTYGLPTGNGAIRTSFKKLIAEHNLPPVVFHSLRHTSVTYKLKLNGGDIKAVQGDSGHSQINMVTDVYSHIIDDDRRKDAEMFEDAFYGKKDLNPQLRKNEEGENVMTVPAGVDAELLAKVLANPEMAALLTSLAKTMK